MCVQLTTYVPYYNGLSSQGTNFHECPEIYAGMFLKLDCEFSKEFARSPYACYEFGRT